MRPATIVLGLFTIIVGLVGLFVLTTVASGGASDNSRTIAIHYSRFSESLVEVKAGVPVTFELRNDDPILHEWIVGTLDVHARHRTGTEPYHDAVPTEVSIPAYETRVTTVTFEHPGDYLFVCHLPGHEEYGMSGLIRVEG
jgi:uncharacterized cupredoxin-like copper-binding protein